MLQILNDQPVVIFNDDSKNYKRSIAQLRERLLKLKTYAFPGKHVIGIAYKDKNGELIIEEIADTEKHFLFGSSSYEFEDNKVGVVVMEGTGMFKKNKVKFATIDLSELIK